MTSVPGRGRPGSDTTFRPRQHPDPRPSPPLRPRTKTDDQFVTVVANVRSDCRLLGFEAPDVELPEDRFEGPGAAVRAESHQGG